MEQKNLIDVWLVDPIRHFINNSTMSGAVLMVSALTAIVLSNSPWADDFHAIWELNVSIQIGEFYIRKTLHHWINDGLMSLFFFVVGLELKRELIAGELSEPKQILLPVAAAVGGILFPACIYLLSNPSGPASDGWGIPMATDIAFALGVLYLLGDRIPNSLKVFLTTLAIVDDLAAVLVIALFYTSSIDLVGLGTGLGFFLVLILSNKLGIRSTLYYAVMGTIGLWYAFLVSGIHPTIAAVLLAFTIPARPKLSKPNYSRKLQKMLDRFRGAKTIDDAPVVSEEQLQIVRNIRKASKMAVTPLQRLEHGLHPLVFFVVMPLFALSNAGISLQAEIGKLILSPVSVGILMGLLLGKSLGIGAVIFALVKLNLARLPSGMTPRHVLGLGILAAIGFTMSLFISGLAFEDRELLDQAKLAILITSAIASITGYVVLRSIQTPDRSPDHRDAGDKQV